MQICIYIIIEIICLQRGLEMSLGLFWSFNPLRYWENMYIVAVLKFTTVCLHDQLTNQFKNNFSKWPSNGLNWHKAHLTSQWLSTGCSHSDLTCNLLAPLPYYLWRIHAYAGAQDVRAGAKVDSWTEIFYIVTWPCFYLFIVLSMPCVF